MYDSCKVFVVPCSVKNTAAIAVAHIPLTGLGTAFNSIQITSYKRSTKWRCYTP
jgi:hypothetical protein